MRLNVVWTLFCCAFLLLPVRIEARELAAEIINTNPAQQVAFIDLGKDSVNVGDVFAVENQGKKIFLEVLESAEAVSKVGICQKDSFKSLSGDFNNVYIGARLARVLSSKTQAPAVPSTTNPMAVQQPQAQAAPLQPAPQQSGMPNIDPQTLVKPNIANETIQSLDSRLDKMVESNVKLFNSLTEMFNEKKQWQATIDGLYQEIQAAKNQVQELTMQNADLVRKLDDAKYQTAQAVTDSEKYKKQSQDLTDKVKVLKERLDYLNKIIEDQLKQ